MRKASDTKGNWEPGVQPKLAHACYVFPLQSANQDKISLDQQPQFYFRIDFLIEIETITAKTKSMFYTALSID